jgi:membrane fusion protein, multidrug efflux system
VNPLPVSSRIVITALLLVLGSLLLSGCGDSQPPANLAPKAVEVGVVTLAAQALTLSTELAGRTSAYMIAQIRPQVGGIVQKRAFEEGAVVKAGDLLYQIDPASYQTTFASAQASLARAESTLNAARLKAQRQSELLAIEAISKQDDEDAQVSLQQAQADLHSAQASLETARINLGHTRITAPISGRVEVSTVTPGALLTANQDTVLTTVQQLDPIYVDIPQSSTEVLQLKQALASGKLKSIGDNSIRIRLQLEDGTTYAHEGRLQVSGVTVDKNTGAITLRALLPNPQRLLMPGMYVRAKLDKAVDPQALLVPQQAISRDTRGQGVALVVLADGKVEQRTVTVAESIGSNWRVTEGLAAGDRVIVEGSSKVRVGQIVHAVAMASTTPAKSGEQAAPIATAAAPAVTK